MKKSILSTTLLSVLAIGGMSITVHADLLQDVTTSNAKITFEGNDNQPTGPVNPDDPDSPSENTDPNDPNNHGTGDQGPLSIDYVSNISFGTQEISQSKAVYTAKNEKTYVQVTDKRGVAGGWTLTASASKFMADDNSELKGAVLSFAKGDTRTTVDNVSEKPDSYGFTFDNNEALPVMAAKSQHGQGTWLDVFEGEEGNNTNIQLSVPAGSAQAKEYSATITWTLTAGPTDAK
ncbi:WxL domain-containing protein [Enterococcus villorum]|uniref:WxL domain-containing protein n=2 Tax=Enterococcus villorum TaxID=112904 RepID=A0A511IZV4_9ENTE|nr:WxL domain-containing protein [Enterococcus villorum]EOH87533.1 hypothetical protein UAO_02244 [Enterococcus villorum ATCC 700913]EOW77748.1 hypothetical protein I591_00602 [Enterococcus villorum ATCC 700913]GEL90923.1 hypothetical protein EVI01_02600 [Enterococcus villorum]